MMKKIFLSLIFCSAVLSAQRLREISNDVVMVAAHRGDWYHTPENSLHGIRLCMDRGVDMLETDIRLTQDDQLVLMHDYTLDRTTTGKGEVSEKKYQELLPLRLKNIHNIETQHRIPRLDEVLDLTQNKMLIYFDKAHQDPKGKPKGYKIKRIIALLKEKNLLKQGVFVLDFPYATAKEIFGEDLEKVNYIPVIDDRIENLETYVDEYLVKLNPVAFQFRIKSVEDKSYQLIPKIKQSGAKLFVAATWQHHTANHDDTISLENPQKGWGWLLDKGFNIIETNYYRELLDFLEQENRR